MSLTKRQYPDRMVFNTLVWIFFAVTVALLFPDLGKSYGLLHSEKIMPLAVFVVLWIQGALFPAEQAIRGVTAWRVHLFCQCWIFLVFPAVTVLCLLQFGEGLSHASKLGLLFLSVLPTTVATNVAFSSQAGGNTAAAIVNVMLSNVLGAILSPIILVWLLAQDSSGVIDRGEMLIFVGWQIILPFCLGQLLRRALKRPLTRYHRELKGLASWMIYFMIYVSICNLVAQGQWGGHALSIQVMGMTLGLMVLLKAGCWLVLCSRKWEHEMKVAAFYAASQKTLAVGLPIATAVYSAAHHPELLPPMGALIFPLVVFHVGQLVAGAVLVPILGQRSTASS